MIDQSSLEGKVIIAAFDLAASPGWAEISLRDIADAAGCSLADVMDHFEDKADVLRVFSKHVDRAMLQAAGDVEREQSARDALFEVIMSRFDLMAPYKVGLKSIVQASPSSSGVADPSHVRLTLQTQNKIMQAAGLSAAGVPALIRQFGLARIYDQVFRVWLNDDDAGMARTMAALDKRLRQGEQTLRTIDDVAKSSERVCEQATSFAARLIAAMRAAASQASNGQSTTGEAATGQGATGQGATGAPDNGTAGMPTADENSTKPADGKASDANAGPGPAPGTAPA